jgi:hypothetical protein
MPRRGLAVTQATITRVLRAYRSEGLLVRVLIHPDGSAAFEPVEEGNKPVEDGSKTTDKEIVL